MDYNSCLNSFAERLVALRQKLEGSPSARGMSLDLGQVHSFINNIERKRNFPSMYNFFEICEYLGGNASRVF